MQDYVSWETLKCLTPELYDQNMCKVQVTDALALLHMHDATSSTSQKDTSDLLVELYFMRSMCGGVLSSLHQYFSSTRYTFVCRRLWLTMC